MYRYKLLISFQSGENIVCIHQCQEETEEQLIKETVVGWILNNQIVVFLDQTLRKNIVIKMKDVSSIQVSFMSKIY